MTKHSRAHGPVADQPSSQPIPDVSAKIVVTCDGAVLYIARCAFCGREHTHGPYRRFPYDNPRDAFGTRSSHCHVDDCGLYRGEGGTYRLVPAPEPACFTHRAARNRDARLTMELLHEGGVATSSEVLQVRDRRVLGWGW